MSFEFIFSTLLYTEFSGYLVDFIDCMGQYLDTEDSLAMNPKHKLHFYMQFMNVFLNSFTYEHFWRVQISYDMTVSVLHHTNLHRETCRA